MRIYGIADRSGVDRALAAVAAVDVDIAVRQIAGPHRRLAVADADIDGDVDVAAFHVAGDRRLVIARHRPALGGDLDPADGDRQAVAVGLLAGLADRHDDPPPIGIARRDRGLDQGRVA